MIVASPRVRAGQARAAQAEIDWVKLAMLLGCLGFCVGFWVGVVKMARWVWG